MPSRLDKRLAKLEHKLAPEIVYSADFYNRVLLSAEDEATADAEVLAWRAQRGLDRAKMAEIISKAERNAAEIEAAALLAWDPNAPPPEE